MSGSVGLFSSFGYYSGPFRLAYEWLRDLLGPWFPLFVFAIGIIGVLSIVHGVLLLVRKK